MIQYSFSVNLSVEGSKKMRNGYQFRLYPSKVQEQNAHRPFNQLPDSIHISVQNGKWYLSFNAEDDTLPTFKEEVSAEKLQRLPEEELYALTIGADRGVAKPLMTFEGTEYHLTEVQKKRICKEMKRKKTLAATGSETAERVSQPEESL